MKGILKHFPSKKNSTAKVTITVEFFILLNKYVYYSTVAKNSLAALIAFATATELIVAPVI